MDKECRKCHQIKPLSEFYKDKRAKDGYYGRCKWCHCQAVTPIRVPRKPARPKSELYEYLKEYSKRPSELPKVLARTAINGKLRDGKIERQPCEVCMETKVDAHHEDYSKPLDVNWLCRLHHKHLHMGKITLTP